MSQIPNIRHDGTLSFGNFMLMMKKPKNLEIEPLHPKNVLLASVVQRISKPYDEWAVREARLFIFFTKK
jgi:hypothetical protein